MTKLEEYINQHIEEKLNEKVNEKLKDENSIIQGIIDTIEQEMNEYRIAIDDCKESGLTLNSLEMEGGLRGLIDLSMKLNIYFLDDRQIKITNKIDK